MQVWLERASGRELNASFHQGNLACLRGDAEQAVEAWKKDGDRSLATLFVAIASFGQGHVLETSLARNFGGYGYGSGVWYERNGNAPAAIRWYSFSLAYEPSVRTAGKLARLYQAQGDIALAEETWQRLAAVFPMNDPGHWESVAQIAELRQSWAAAAEAYGQAAALADPSAAYSLWLQSGNMWKRAKAYGPSENAFRQAAALEPEKMQAYLQMGNLCRVQKQYEEATAWYQQAQRVAPEHFAPPYYLGLVAWAQQRYGEALADFDQSLMLKPDNANALYYKAMVLKALERHHEAIETLKKAIALRNNPPENWIKLLAKWKEEVS